MTISATIDRIIMYHISNKIKHNKRPHVSLFVWKWQEIKNIEKKPTGANLLKWLVLREYGYVTKS